MSKVKKLRKLMTNEETMKVIEGFKAQKAPKAGPSKGKFQRKMRRRLSKAHATYLDMGRKDLTKHGGGFHLDRPKDISNAFLAEEEIDEASATPAIAGYAGPIGKKTYKRKDEQMKTQERKLRIKIREGLKEFFSAKAKSHEKKIGRAHV